MAKGWLSYFIFPRLCFSTKEAFLSSCLCKQILLGEAGDSQAGSAALLSPTGEESRASSSSGPRLLWDTQGPSHLPGSDLFWATLVKRVGLLEASVLQKSPLNLLTRAPARGPERGLLAAPPTCTGASPRPLRQESS